MVSICSGLAGNYWVSQFHGEELPSPVPASYKAVTTLSSLLEEMKSTMTHNAICIDLEIIPFYCARAADLAEGARRDMLSLTEQ